MKGENDLENITIEYKFAQEFGRLLTPMEKEIISDWLKENTEEIIIKALKEAVFNGAVHMRYINKILKSWKNENQTPDLPEPDLSWLK